MTSTEPSRRSFFGHLAGAVAATGVVYGCVDTTAQAGEAVSSYRLVMGRYAEVEASPIWSDVERWNDDEAAALSRMAAAPGDLRDLLAKVVILAERADAGQWNLMDPEYDLFASVREQALDLLRSA
jgi:hypothetical protein